MRSVSTCVHNSAMAPEARKDLMEISNDNKPIVWPKMSTVERSSVVNKEVVMWCHDVEK
jgi:hypothetical protein